MRSSYALIVAPAQDEEPEGFWAKVKATAGRVPMVETPLAAWYCAIDDATRRLVCGERVYRGNDRNSP